MKQNVGYEEITNFINEDFKNFKKLFKILFNDIKDEDISIIRNEVHCDSLYISIGVIPYYLTIGKMIEILNICTEKKKENQFFIHKEWYPYYSIFKWHVWFYCEEEFIRSELCDALWESIKHILKEAI